MRDQWLREGFALASGGVLGSAAPACAWAVGDGRPLWVVAGLGVGFAGGVVHEAVLRRSLARQAGGMLAQVHEIGDRVLTGVPTPRAETVLPAAGVPVALVASGTVAVPSPAVGGAGGAGGGGTGGDTGGGAADPAVPGGLTGGLAGGPSAGARAGDPPVARGALPPAVPDIVPGSFSGPGASELLERTLTTLLLSAREATEQARREADRLLEASHDTLTGLPNRATLLRLAEEAVAAAGTDSPLSVLMIDLDRFKDVNDSLGHAIGDLLLAEVGLRLRSVLRPLDSIARLGGDEFAVLLPAVVADGARRVADRLAEALDTPFSVDGMDLHVEASIGIAVSHRPDQPDTRTVEGLLREAEIAMYRAKDEGAGIVIFEPGHDSGDGRFRLELSADLRRAITESQLVVHYQPVVDVVEGRLAGVEALVRWQHPERGLVGPGAFLPLAEQTGLIIPLSRQVLMSAVRQAAAWRDSGCPVQIAVNLSPRWLQFEDVPEVVSSALAAHDLSPDLLRLEITESAVLAHPQHAHEMLSELRAMGIGLSLDDFGTGYSSMTRLRYLPVDELKVDREFVHAMTTSAEDAVIVRAAVELGRNLGMDVVAEGIEDADTLAEIVAAGCSLAQGYYFAQALPADELVSWATDRFPGFGRGEPASRRPRAARL